MRHLNITDNKDSYVTFTRHLHCDRRQVMCRLRVISTVTDNKTSYVPFTRHLHCDRQQD